MIYIRKPSRPGPPLYRILQPLLLAILCPATALPFSSHEKAPTHQYILKEAYARLQKDPAFKVNREAFPSLEQILSNEGVSLDLSTLKLTGPGPDGDGNTYFSNHYYNPDLADNPPAPGKTPGYAPDLVASNFACLADPTQQVLKEKYAAWGAHFLADLFVPFHVVGNYYLYINRLNPALGVKTTGIVRTMGYKCLLEHGPDFSTEINLFEESRTSDEKVDWFDPWYYNGNSVDINDPALANLPILAELNKSQAVIMGPSTKTSSHVLWESRILLDANYNLSGLGLDWINPEPTTDTPWARQAEQARLFARSAARMTRDDAGDLLAHPGVAVKYAIANVYQLWRASITGLRLKLDHEPFHDPKDPAYNNSYRFSVTPVNHAGSAVTNVRITATVLNGDLVGKDLFPADQTLKSLPANGAAGSEMNVLFWYVRPANNNCRVVFEITGRYDATPDLQYFMAQQPLAPCSTLTVLVTDARDGKPLPNALVSAADQRFPVVRTTADGSAVIPGLTIGTYTVRAAASGYRMNTGQAAIANAEACTLRIALEKVDPSTLAGLTPEQQKTRQREYLLAKYRIIAPLWADWCDSKLLAKGIREKTIFEALAVPDGKGYQVSGHKQGWDRQTGKEFKASAWNMILSLSEIESLTAGKIRELQNDKRQDLVNKAFIDSNLDPFGP